MPLTQRQTTFMWVLATPLAILFVGVGAGKLIGIEPFVENFAKFGYPSWFRMLIGLIEVVCGIGLALPKYAPEAGSVLIMVMIGAVITEVMAGGPWLPALLCLFAVAGATNLRSEA